MKIFLSVALLGAFAAVAVVAGRSKGNREAGRTGWNKLLNAHRLFDESINDIQLKSHDEAQVLAQLRDLLSNDETLLSLYSNYKSQFGGKNVKTATEEAHVAEFRDQLLKIATHNVGANRGEHGWWMGVNQFTDMTAGELGNLRSALPTPKTNNTVPYVSSPSVAAPASKSYVDEGRVSPPKNEGDCSPASGAFAAVAALESAEAIKKKAKGVWDYSVQEVLDCMLPGHFSCKPGNPHGSIDNSLKTLEYNNDAYWYEYPLSEPVAIGKCGREGKRRRAGVASSKANKVASDDELKSLLVESGPVVLQIHASDALRKDYARGVYPGSECGSNKVNRAMLLVGYGSEGGQDYWLFKNSWGQEWGVQGYLKLARNGASVCGVLGTAYSVVAR